MAERACDNEIGGTRLRFVLQPVSDFIARNVFQAHRADVCAMPLEVLNNLFARRTGVALDKARRIDHDDRRTLGALDQRQRIAERTRRGAARIPGNRNVTTERGERSVGWYEKDRAAAD